jgi:hypothetical protein
MSIRLVARDLYRLIRRCEALERKLALSPPGEKAAVEAELRRTRVERDRLRRALDGSKER